MAKDDGNKSENNEIDWVERTFVLQMLVLGIKIKSIY